MAAQGDPAMAGMPWVVGVITTLIERATERNDAAAPGAFQATSAFRARRKPDISVRAYMTRIAQFAECSPACFMAAYIYLDRHRALAVVDSYSVHRLLIAAVLAAVKFIDGGTCGCRRSINAYFARVGGISLPEMNRLELAFLFGVDFDLNVRPKTFGDYCAMLQIEMLRLEPEPEAPLPLPTPEDDDGSSSRSQQQPAA